MMSNAMMMNRTKVRDILRAYIAGHPMDRKLNDKLCSNTHVSCCIDGADIILIYYAHMFLVLLLLLQ